MGKRTQTLNRGRLEKNCYGRTNRSLRCFDHTEEHLWDAEQLKVCWKSAWRHLSVKHGGGNVMVWGCFGAGKVGDIFRVKGILNKEISLYSICNGVASAVTRSKPHWAICGSRLTVWYGRSAHPANPTCGRDFVWVTPNFSTVVHVCHVVNCPNNDQWGMECCFD